MTWSSLCRPPSIRGAVVVFACLVVLVWPASGASRERRPAGAPPSSRIEEGYRQLHAGRTREAEALFRAHLSKEPRSLAAHEGLVWTHVKRGELEQAARAADARLALAPGDLAWRKKWIEVVGEVPARLTEAIAAARALVHERPRDVEASVLLGKLLTATEEGLPEAVAAYRRALALAPGDLEARRGLARALNWSARYGEAILAYRAVIAAGPDIAVQKELAQTLVSAGRYEEAAAAYREVVALAPDDRAARRDLAKALSSAGQAAEAMRVFDGLLGEDPRDEEALRGRAQIARWDGDFETARNLLERAAAVRPGDGGLQAELRDVVPRAAQLRTARRDVTLPLLFGLIGVGVAIGYVSARLNPRTYLLLAGYAAGLIALALSWLYLDR